MYKHSHLNPIWFTDSKYQQLLIDSRRQHIDEVIERTNTRTISPALRFKVLSKFNYTCQYCGAKAPDVKLHLDHIVPFSKGGLTEESNLTVACDLCNIGKSDTLLNVKPESTL
jgi:5-methylcytosine-specific restriction endonuclease McrA